MEHLLTTLMNTDNQFFIRVISPEPLKKAAVASIYKLIAASLPSGVISSIQVERPEYGLDTVRLIHKTGDAGSHVYEIPLSRNLRNKEFDKLVDAVTPFLTEQQTLESSGSDPLDARQMPVGAPQLEPDQYDILCNTLAKYQHSAWYADKAKMGWRLGADHNTNQKTSPLMRPWEDLPSEYRRVDSNLPEQFFRAIEALDYVVVPRKELEKLLKKKR
jgi:RyR domain